MDFISFVVAFLLAAFLWKLSSRVDAVEDEAFLRIEKLEALTGFSKTVKAPSNNGQEDYSESKNENVPEVITDRVYKKRASESSFNFGDWLKEDWIMKLGALLLLIGLGWFTTYAFANNWIGSVGRITLGLLLGAIFLIVGFWRIEKHQNQGEVFSVIGSTTILITTFAARVYYGFFDPTMALILMFLSVAFVAFVGVKYKSKYLPIISLILAGVAPLLTHSVSPDYVGLFSYLLIIVLGTIWVVAINGQRGLVTASLLIVFFYSLPQLFDKNVELLWFAYLFTFIFFIANIISILKSETKKIEFNMLTAGMTAIFLLVWVLSAEQQEFKSLIIAAWMLVFAIGAFLVVVKTGRKEPFYVYALASISMLAAATAIQLQGEALLVAYTVESIMISLLIYFTMQDTPTAESFTFLLIGPVAISLLTVTNYANQTALVNRDFFSLIILIIGLFGTGLFFWNKAKEYEETDYTWVNNLWVILGSIFSYIVLWIFNSKLFPVIDIAATVSLVIYTVVAIVVYFYGVWYERKGFRIYGQALLGLVIVRLFLVDIWNMEMTGKIITFLLIGILLISTAFLGKKKPLN